MVAPTVPAGLQEAERGAMPGGWGHSPIHVTGDDPMTAPPSCPVGPTNRRPSTAPVGSSPGWASPSRCTACPRRIRI
ncbi:hypothetical protein [Streptomyces sp. NPDC054842]